MVSTAGHKKGYENMNYSTLPDYGLLTGLSIVTVHRGAERIHSELLNILLAFPCRMYPMDYVCVLHTLRIDSFYYVNH